MLKKRFSLVALLLALILTCGCGPARQEEETTIRIGSKNFTEQLILAEIMAQVLEEQTELKVERAFNLGGTMICHNALLEGQIDLYPEYTGTGLTAILNQEAMTDPAATFRTVAAAYRQQFQLEWLSPFGFNNTYAITVRRRDARENNWTRISDLHDQAGQLEAGFTAEFIERSDGYPGLQERYRLSFASVRDMDPGLMYQAVNNGEVDVICAFSTDGRIEAYDLLPLEDDRAYFPPYYAAPVIRTTVLKKYPAVEKSLAQLADLIDNKEMQKLNYAVDEAKAAPRDVARRFLIDRGIITTQSSSQPSSN